MLLQIPTYATIARNKAESAHPEMWPVHAWCPAIQRGGNVVQDFCGQAHATMNGTWDWNPDLPGIRTPYNGTSYNYGSLPANSLTDMGQDFTADVVLYTHDYKPSSSGSEFLLGKSTEGSQNSLLLRYIYGDWSTTLYCQQYRDGWTANSDQTTHQLGNPISTPGDRFSGIWLIRFVCPSVGVMKAWVNNSYAVGTNADISTMAWNEVTNLFGRTNSYTYVTYSNILSISLHNRIIDEPLTDPFSWLRKHKRKYYRATTTSGPNLAAAAYYYQRMIAG